MDPLTIIGIFMIGASGGYIVTRLQSSRFVRTRTPVSRDDQLQLRLSIESSVSLLRSSGALLHCRTINVSQKGMAVSSPSPLKVDESVEIVFALPNSEVLVHGRATIVWDEDGKSGLRFEHMSPEVLDRLEAWLGSNVLNRLDSRTVKLPVLEGGKVPHAVASPF